MKFFLIVVILASFQAQLTVGQSIQDIINDFVEGLKNLIPEPIDLPEVDLDVPENDYVAGYIHVTEGYLSGVRNFSVDVRYRGVIIPIPTGFTINLSWTEFNDRFLSGLEVYNSTVDYTGDVHINAITTDLVIDGELDFSLIPLNFSISSLQFNVGHIKVTVEGLVSEKFSEVLSALLTQYGATIVNALQERISSRILDIINGIIQGIFSEMYLQNPDIDTVEVTQETSLEQLKMFFETLQDSFGFQYEDEYAYEKK